MNSNTVENTNNVNEVSNNDNDDKNNMNGDDSKLVEDILTELNQENPPAQTQQETVEDNVSNAGSESRPMLDSSPMMDMSPDIDIPPAMDVEYDSDENASNSFMKKIKKPLIVLCLCYLLFNPMVRNLLAKYLPRVFSESAGTLVQQGQVLLLSLIVAVLFMGTNLLE